MRKVLSNDKIHQSAHSAMAKFHPNAVSEIEAAIAAHDWVVVGMAQNPVVMKARKVLNAQNIQFHYIEHGSYFSGWKIRLAIKLWSGWPTFPQIFHKGILIGGCADLEKYLKKK